MRSTAHPGVLAFGVFTHDDPIEILGTTTFQGRVDARQYAGGSNVGVLIKTLANLQAQAPQGHMIRNVWVTRRTKQDGVFGDQVFQSIGRHHHTVLAIIIAAPFEILEIKFQMAIGLGQLLHDMNASGHDFFADAVAGDGCNFVYFHACHFNA